MESTGNGWFVVLMWEMRRKRTSFKMEHISYGKAYRKKSYILGHCVLPLHFHNVINEIHLFHIRSPSFPTFATTKIDVGLE